MTESASRSTDSTIYSAISISSAALAAIILCLFALPAAAGELEIQGGEALMSADGDAYAYVFEVPAGLTAALSAAEVGDTVLVGGFPVALGVHQRLELQRYQVYAPGARIVVAGAAGEREIPRSRRLQFLGSPAGDSTTRVGLSFDPASGRMRGVVDGPLGEFLVLESAPEDGGGGRYRLESTVSVLARADVELEARCGSDRLPLPASLDGLLVRVPGANAATRLSGTPTHLATVAVDTDVELLDEKFGDDTGAATDWLADLFTEMNVAYERDVAMRLLQGDTFLRTGADDTDPWDVEGSGASFEQLDEFGSYWSANMGAVDRVFAMLLSGKASSGNSSSGIAWLDGYCEYQSTGGGYSVTQVFTNNLPVTLDVRIIAHELGHNFGSPHTHCYSPPVDQCYNAQNGCYDGTPSCPPGGSGTLMSYCHFSPPSGAGCGQNLIEFHPTVIALFDGFIASHTPSCIEELAEDEIFSDGFESGDTDAWQ